MTADGMKQVQAALDGFRTNRIDEVRSSTRDLDTAMDAVGDTVVDTRGKIDDLGDSAKGLDNAAAEVERLTSNIMEFFSISNTVQIFKRTVQDAIETVKELDAAMTQTAVVTEFDIGDMWS
jgi:methyl-accepting chemotaxis protein